jgi:hypothetical protein
MNAALDQWLNRATRCLSKDATAKVRAEIQDHFETAREAALNGGAAPQAAGRAALLALGDAAALNRGYRKTLITASEARLLREANWEVRMICSRRAAKWGLVILPALVIAVGIGLSLAGNASLSRTLLFGGLTLAVVLTVPLFPIYTVQRARVYRLVKWSALAATLWFALEPTLIRSSWFLSVTALPLLWTEWTRFSMRRKLPAARWPKHLYL